MKKQNIISKLIIITIMILLLHSCGKSMKTVIDKVEIDETQHKIMYLSGSNKFTVLEDTTSIYMLDQISSDNNWIIVYRYPNMIEEGESIGKNEEVVLINVPTGIEIEKNNIEYVKGIDQYSWICFKEKNNELFVEYYILHGSDYLLLDSSLLDKQKENK